VTTKGYTVIGIDSRDEPLELVRKFGKMGPDYTLNSLRDTDPAAVLPKGLRVDASILLTGNSKAIPYATKVLSMYGTFVAVGFCLDGFTFDSQAVSPPLLQCLSRANVPSKLQFKYITVIGSRMGGREHLEEVLDLVANSDIQIPMHYRNGLDELNQMVDDLRDPKSTGKFGIRFKAEA
jgi:D-arabinose 1-dehydrogenase-like Zn-dependent alcohol dehydrogenase